MFRFGIGVTGVSFVLSFFLGGSVGGGGGGRTPPCDPMATTDFPS